MHFCAVFLLHFTTDQKQLVTSSGRFVSLNVPDKYVSFMILVQTVLEKFHPKPSEAAFSTVFSNFDNCQPKVASDVISVVVVVVDRPV